MLRRTLLALLACLPLAAGDPPTKPILQVETGMLSPAEYLDHLSNTP